MRPAFLFASWSLVAALALAGCGSKSTSPPASENAAADNVAQAAEATAPINQARANNDVAISDKAGETEFSYSWPQAAAGIAVLDGWLRANGEDLRKRTMSAGRSEAAEAQKAGYPFRGHTYEEHWGVVADGPALLIMQSLGYVFTGGAHGMPIVTTLIWDKASGKRLPADAVLDMAMLNKGLNDRFCAALDAERAKRRGEPVKSGDPNQLDEFVRCVDLAKQTVLPVSLKGGALDTIRVVIMPYEAGPYSEGIYQLDLPVDAATLQAVRPIYKDAFVQS